MAFRTLLLISFLLLPTSLVYASGICVDYKQPSLLNENEFQQTRYGTLGLKHHARNRFLSFNETGCYDLHNYRRSGEYPFFINSKSDRSYSTYLTAAISKTYSGEMRGVPKVAVNLFRNKHQTDVKASWAKALEEEETYQDGGAIMGDNFDITTRGFDSPEELDVSPEGSLDQLDLINVPDFAEAWHALIVDTLSRPNIGTPYRVLENTRHRINDIKSSIVQIPRDQAHTITKIYLIKYQTSKDPSFMRPHIKPAASDCIYVDYRVDGKDTIPIDQNGNINFLVLRFSEDVNC